MNYQDALQWLYGTQLFGIKLGLDNASRLVSALDAHPANKTILHVAGTNGKGSVCAMAESIAREAGYRTGLYTSPHLISYNERIKINGVDVSDALVAKELTNIRALIAEWDPHPTFFEISTALALKVFKEENCEIIILETGMGGRLDATNIVTPNVSVLTKIDLDHAQWLGDTLAEIASEKAGIIKPHTPAVTLEQEPEVLKVLQETANKNQVPLQVITSPLTDFRMALSGNHQQLNAALALAALELANLQISQENLARGLANTDWPGRFQQIRPGIYLDGAHNPAAARMLVETWKAFGPYGRLTIMIGMLADKDVITTIQALSPIAANWIALAPRSNRALKADALADLIRKVSYAPVVVSNCLGEALKNTQPPMLVCGSLFLIGEVLGFYKKKVFEVSSQ